MAELTPRIRIRLPLPTMPSFAIATTPATRPFSTSVSEVTGAASTSWVASMRDTELPSSRLSCSPVAVVTISSRVYGTAARAQSIVAACPAATVTGFWVEPYPSITTRRV